MSLFASYPAIKIYGMPLHQGYEIKDIIMFLSRRRVLKVWYLKEHHSQDIIT
jgi:hypothetical protein